MQCKPPGSSGNIEKDQLKPQLFPSWKVHAIQLKIIILLIYQMIPYESCSRHVKLISENNCSIKPLQLSLILALSPCKGQVAAVTSQLHIPVWKVGFAPGYMLGE